MVEPKLNSKWVVVGTLFRFELIDIWGIGIGHRYKRTLYELKYAHRVQHQIMPVEKFHQLVEDGKIETLKT